MPVPVGVRGGTGHRRGTRRHLPVTILTAVARLWQAEYSIYGGDGEDEIVVADGDSDCVEYGEGFDTVSGDTEAENAEPPDDFVDCEQIG